jgi:hypothetical protein
MRRPQRQGGRLAAPPQLGSQPGLLAEALLAGPWLADRADVFATGSGSR